MYNSKLSNKFPFDLNSDKDVSIRQTDRLIEVMEKNKEMLDKVKDPEKRAFIDKLAHIKSLMALTKDENPPIVNMNVLFRANRDYEQGANQIINWILKIGDKSINYRNPDLSSINWKYGDEIKLIIRWAQSSPFIPQVDKNKSFMKVFGKNVVYEFKNKWALFSFLKYFSKKSDNGFFSRMCEIDINTKKEMSDKIELSRLFIKLDLEQEKRNIKVPYFR